MTAQILRQASREFLITMGLIVGGVPLVIGTAWTFGTHSTNCGGNSAALAQVGNIATFARDFAMYAPGRSFDFTADDAVQREDLAQMSRDSWLHGARFLVSTAPIAEHETQPHRVIVVCDTPYRNVPRRRFISAPPTHAAAFADGSTGLISTAEFAALDRSQFKPLDELYPTKPQ